MLMLNDLDRCHLVADVIDRVSSLGARHAALRQHMLDERLRCRAHTPPHRYRRARLALARRVALIAGRWSRVEVPVGPGPAGPNT
jgi:hypothetical protein